MKKIGLGIAVLAAVSMNPALARDKSADKLFTEFFAELDQKNATAVTVPPPVVVVPTPTIPPVATPASTVITPTLIPVSVVPPQVVPAPPLPSAPTTANCDPSLLPVSNATAVASLHMGIGDKIKVVFYQLLPDAEAQRWNKENPLSGFQQFPDLSGEFTVQDDGTIAFPLLGNMAAAGHTLDDLKTALADIYTKQTKQKGFATISFVERPPVYVLGTKTPGSFPYKPGMTVLHAVALSGGILTPTVEPWQKSEIVRASIRLENTNETLAELWARDAVLKAERDHVDAEIPTQLLKMVGEDVAKRMIAAETDRRSSIVASNKLQLTLMDSTMVMAKQDLEMLEHRSGPWDAMVKLRQEHADALRGLMANGTLSRIPVMDAQAALSDSQQRQQDAATQIEQARERVAQLAKDRVKAEADARSQLDNAIIQIEQQIATYQKDNLENQGVLGVFNVDLPPGTPDPTAKGGIQPVRQVVPAPTYEIVRQGVKMRAQEMTILVPGDLVQVVATQGTNTPPSPTAPSGPTNINAGCK
jgi:protein involved in polysaccharide export with SLBB domain